MSTDTIIKTWIFQANPSKYDILNAFTDIEDEFTTTRYIKQIQQGDNALLWISGKEAGIYAIGKIIRTAIIKPDDAAGLERWKDKELGTRSIARVRLTYDTVLDKPLLKEYIQCTPELWNLSILHFANATNFKVTPAEWTTIQSLINSLPPDPEI